jgi:hypothetical protein
MDQSIVNEFAKMTQDRINQANAEVEAAKAKLALDPDNQELKSDLAYLVTNAATFVAVSEMTANIIAGKSEEVVVGELTESLRKLMLCSS